MVQTVPSQGEESYVVVDYHSKKILYSKGSQKKRPVASLTKVATAMVVLDWADLTQTNMASWIKVPQSVAQMGGANPLGLRPGDEITIRDALYSAIIGSDNAAAQTLATFVGYDFMRRQGRGGDPVGVFVAQMNALAKTKGCVATRFTNPHGLDHLKPTPHSTAADMARLTHYAMSKAAFRYYCNQQQRKLAVRRAGQEQHFVVKNTNKLLGTEGIDGVKTGMTSKAGGCLITSATRPSTIMDISEEEKRIIPHRLIVVVLGSYDRFNQSLKLVRDGWRAYDSWYAAGRPVQTAEEILSTEPVAR